MNNQRPPRHRDSSLQKPANQRSTVLVIRSNDIDFNSRQASLERKRLIIQNSGWSRTGDLQTALA